MLSAAVGVAAAQDTTRASGTAALDPKDESHDFRFPGPDTMALPDGSGRYITYGASAHRRKVPYSIHGRGDDVGVSSTINGDAMPGGGGAWVAAGSGIWSPGAIRVTAGDVSRYYLFYTATHRNDDGRKCIGVARSRKPTSDFHSAATPLVCPKKGDRWAIDADVVRGPKGAIWLVWRDGQRAVGPESALSVMRLAFHDDGSVSRASTPHVLLRSDRLAWTHYRDNGMTVIENPSLFYRKGSWYLFYSGNSWSTNYYATGIAHCGAHLGDDLCTPMPGPKRAWFSYAGPRAHLPSDQRKYGLPGNKRGPGAMAVFRARDGQPWVTWNYLSDEGGRKSRTGKLMVNGSGANADFRMVLR